MQTVGRSCIFCCLAKATSLCAGSLSQRSNFADLCLHAAARMRSRSQGLPMICAEQGSQDMSSKTQKAYRVLPGLGAMDVTEAHARPIKVGVSRPGPCEELRRDTLRPTVGNPHCRSYPRAKSKAWTRKGSCLDCLLKSEAAAAHVESRSWMIPPHVLSR